MTLEEYGALCIAYAKGKATEIKRPLGEYCEYEPYKAGTQHVMTYKNANHFNWRLVDEYRELKEAFARGETVEYRGSEVWDVIEDPVFDDDVDNYRIQPKAKTLYHFAFKNSCGGWVRSMMYETLEDARKAHPSAIPYNPDGSLTVPEDL
jgi:hypothetical protein